MPLTLLSYRPSLALAALPCRLWSAVPLDCGAASELICDSFWSTGVDRSISRSVLFSSTCGASPDIAWVPMAGSGKYRSDEGKQEGGSV